MKPNRQDNSHAVESSAPLLPRESHVEVFNRGSRPRRDVGWLVVYALVMVTCIGGGIYGFLNRNPEFGHLVSPDTMENPASCPLATHSRKLMQADPESQPWRLDAYMAHALGWTSLAVGGALCVGALFLYMVKHSAGGLVGGAVALQIALPLAVGVVMLAQGAGAAATGPLVLAGLAALVFWLWREQLGLVVRLLGVAGHALLDSPALIVMAVMLQLCWVVVVLMPLMVGGLAAFMNGHLVYNDARVDAGTAARPDQCVDAEGQAVSCCSWRPDPWVGPFLGVVGLGTVWSTCLMFGVKEFTVAGTVGQWYFAPVSESSLPSASRETGRRRVMTSLGHALGPSLGTLCFSSAIVTLMQYLRAALEKAEQQSDDNICWTILAACLRGLFTLIEFLTKFSVYYAALTGDGLLAAGRGATDLLKRNFMDAFGVWWLPSMILQNCALVAALTWGWVTWNIGWYGAHWGQLGGNGTGSAALLSGLSFLSAWTILAFFCSLLLNVVDAVFLCYAMDRDAATCTRLEVHEVYARLPTVGPVVENPAGDVAYGRPTQPPAQPHMYAQP